MNYLSGSQFKLMLLLINSEVHLVVIHINLEFLFCRFLAGPVVVVIATYKIPKWER